MAYETASTEMVKTRLLILSDTHGMDLAIEDKPTQHADVAIHCADLSDGSKLDEFRTILQLLCDLDAPLKLVIAGNHDFTMDIPAFEKHIKEAATALDPKLVEKEYGPHGEARQMFVTTVAQEAGIVFLDEGTHHFTLANGASLTVYASPYTPAFGAWGFQYDSARGYDFAIEQGTDLAITHGPPYGIMDYTYGRERAGCPYLFSAVAKARPRIHCFGHTHEGWGAKLVAWRSRLSESPSHLRDIDNERSVTLERLANLKQSRFDSPEATESKAQKLKAHAESRCCTTSHCTGDQAPLTYGTRTLFVNASVMGDEEIPVQRPWLVDIELNNAP